MNDNEWPFHTLEVVATHSRIRKILRHQLWREPTAEELATQLGITPTEVVEIATLGMRRFDLDEMMGNPLAHIRLNVLGGDEQDK